VLGPQIPPQSCELDWVKLCLDAWGLQARAMAAPDHRPQSDVSTRSRSRFNNPGGGRL